MFTYSSSQILFLVSTVPFHLLDKGSFILKSYVMKSGVENTIETFVSYYAISCHTI